MTAIALDLPDEPRWVEAHGMAGDPESWRRALGAGAAIGNDRARLAVVHGEVDPAAVAALATELATYTLLFVGDELAASLAVSTRRCERAILHTLADPDALPDLEGAVRLPAGAEIPPELAELRHAHNIWAAYVDGAPVCFAYAPWRSTRWFDISVDTLPGSRQLGLATIVAAAMIRDERACGREPVWGADEANVASLRLAKRLGFAPVDELWVAPPR